MSKKLNRYRYICRQAYRKAVYNKRKYALYIISFYIGLLLPALCLANMRYVAGTVELATFDRMSDAVIIDWFAKDFDAVTVGGEAEYSMTAHYEETFAGQEERYLSVTGIDENSFRPIPSLIGKAFSASDHQNGESVCLLSKKDAEALFLKLNDTIKVKDTPITVVGLVDDARYDGMILPYSTMKKLYSGKERVQLSATVIPRLPADKDTVVRDITEQIDGLKDSTSLISVSDGEDLYNRTMQDAMRWRLLRLAIAAVALAFFLTNEILVLLGKSEIEKRTIGVLLSLGVDRRDISVGMIIDAMIIVLPAALLAMLSLMPLAKMAGIDSAISEDGCFAGLFLSLSLGLCAICSYILIRKTASISISELIGSQERK